MDKNIRMIGYNEDGIPLRTVRNGSKMLKMMEEQRRKQENIIPPTDADIENIPEADTEYEVFELTI